MILSASRRTDIPALYPRWLLERLRQGTVLVPNPRNPQMISRVQLSPDVVDCLVLWTKNPLPLEALLPRLEEMGYPFCLQFTLTPYGRELETNLPPKAELEEALVRLGRRWGRERVLWRYDPIVLTAEWTAQRHLKAFQRLCDRLAAHTTRVTISFVDEYPRLRRRGIRGLEPGEMEELGAGLGRIAAEHGLPIQACCEQVDLRSFGVERGSCLRAEDLEKVCGYPLRTAPERNQRPGCGCCESVDIGMYDTCTNGCRYCYANRSEAAARAGLLAHRAGGELLTGVPATGARIVEREALSLRDGQLRIF